jgi:hypothetical protein
MTPPRIGCLTSCCEHLGGVGIRMCAVPATCALEPGAVTVLLGDVAAGGALPRRIGGVDCVDPASSFLRFDADPIRQPSQRRIGETPVQPRLRCYPLARTLEGAFSRLGHIDQFEVFECDHSVAGDDVLRNVTGPVLALMMCLGVDLGDPAVEPLPFQRPPRVRGAFALEFDDRLPRFLTNLRILRSVPSGRAAVTAMPRSTAPTCSFPG